MRPAIAIGAAMMLAGALLALRPAAAAGATSFVVLEGDVEAVLPDTLDGEVGLDVHTPDGTRRVALAPAGVLEAVGFDIRVGDHVRVRAFRGDGSTIAVVHKVLNLTRHQMVRLRTYHGEPLWDVDGRWMGTEGDATGGPARRGGGGSGGRQGGGPGSGAGRR